MNLSIKKYIPLIVLATVSTVSLLWLIFFKSSDISARLVMETDAMSVVDYYIPQFIRLSDKPVENVKALPESRPGHKSLYGALHIGDHADSLITVVLHQSPDSKSVRLFIDKNNNEDLSDDGNLQQVVKDNYWSWYELVDVRYKGFSAVVPYPVRLYRYSDILPEVLVVFRDGYRRGEVVLEDSVYRFAIFDDDLNGRFNEPETGALIVDLNRDGVLDGSTDSPEYMQLFSPFPAGEHLYRIKKVSVAGDLVVFTRTDSMHSREPLTINDTAPSFRAYDLNGNVVDLDAMTNRVILLDFWATWCKPWKNELSLLQRINRRYQNRGFEIIGISLDYNMDILKEFLETESMPWTQIAYGMGWENPLAELYQINALPARILIDRQGKLRFKNLHGKTLESQVVELLNETNEPKRTIP
jgi:thiol-disulfide isomerase/thioredoxin